MVQTELESVTVTIRSVLTRQWWDLSCSLLWTVCRHSSPPGLIWVLCSFDLEHKKGTFSLSDNTRQLLHSCLKFVWKSLRVKTAREKRPAAANSLSLQKSQEEEWPWQEDVECVCVWSLQSPGDVVGKLSAGWTAAESRRAGWEEEEGHAILQCWHPHWDSGQPWNKSCEEAERKKETAPVVYFVQTKRESHLWKKVIEPRFVCSWMAESKYGWKCSVSFTDFNCEKWPKTAERTRDGVQQPHVLPTRWGKSLNNRLSEDADILSVQTPELKQTGSAPCARLQNKPLAKEVN